MVHSDGTDEGLSALHKALDRLQDELLSVDRHKRRDIDILKDIDNIERLIDEHERDEELRGRA